MVKVSIIKGSADVIVYRLNLIVWKWNCRLNKFKTGL
jgi:hypothetical protein